MKLIKSELNWNQNGIVLDTIHMAPKYENKGKKKQHMKVSELPELWST